ncbi:MAG: hypothetical protein NT091_00900 [Candidatus Falkowbacteria bacterium]|nr:hypothetical protein [Candidatus Falkowbacteria bacterium]
MKINQSKIGIFPWSLDYFLAPDLDVYYLVAKDSSEEKWVNQFLDQKKNKVMYYQFTKKQNSLDQQIERNIFKYSNIAKKLKENKINFICTTGDVNKFSRDWAIKNKIEFIETKNGWQAKLENKIYFDKFLTKNSLAKPKSLISKPSAGIFKQFKNQAIVLQQASSCGGEGTFFLKNNSDLDQLILTKKIRSNYQYLWREKKEGASYGATLFIAPGIVALSALRLQCFEYKKDKPQEFKGVQWVSTSSLNQKEQALINDTFQKLGQALSGKIFLENFSSQKPYLNDFKFYLLPQSDFNGSVLELLKPAGIVKALHQTGIYSYANEKIVFQDPDIRKINIKKKEFIFMSLLNSGFI